MRFISFPVLLAPLVLGIVFVIWVVRKVFF